MQLTTPWHSFFRPSSFRSASAALLFSAGGVAGGRRGQRSGDLRAGDRRHRRPEDPPPARAPGGAQRYTFLPEKALQGPLRAFKGQGRKSRKLRNFFLWKDGGRFPGRKGTAGLRREESAKGKALRGRLSSPPPGQCGWRDQTRGCVLSVNPRTPPRSASPPLPPPPLRSPDLQRRRQRHRGLQCHKGVRFATPMAPPFPHRSRTPAGRGGPWVPGGPRRPAPGPIPRPPAARRRKGEGPDMNQATDSSVAADSSKRKRGGLQRAPGAAKKDEGRHHRFLHSPGSRGTDFRAHPPPSRPAGRRHLTPPQRRHSSQKRSKEGNFRPGAVPVRCRARIRGGARHAEEPVPLQRTHLEDPRVRPAPRAPPARPPPRARRGAPPPGPAEMSEWPARRCRSAGRWRRPRRRPRRRRGRSARRRRRPRSGEPPAAPQHVSRLGELGVAPSARGPPGAAAGRAAGGLTGVPPARRYTGYIPSLEETIGRTPIHAQTEAHQVPSKQANLSVRDTTATGGIDNRNGCAPKKILPHPPELPPELPSNNLPPAEPSG